MVCVLGAAMMLAACGSDDVRSTPEAALQSLQTALRDDAAARALVLLDADTQAYFRQEVRTARAVRAARENGVLAEPSGGGGDPAAFEITQQGSPEDAAAALAMAGRPLADIADWLVGCTVVKRDIMRGDDGRQMATLRVRAPDGAENDVFMVHEQDGWAFDGYRHFQVMMTER
jgi:hypothetical protein